MESNKITLGGKEYTIRPLKLREQRALGIGAGKIVSSPEGAFAGSLDHSVNVIVTDLKPDYPEMTAEGLLDSPIGVWEIHAAADAILVLSGFVKKEGVPGETPASTGPA